MAINDQKVASPLVWEFYRYWRDLAGGAAPERDLFDPGAVAKLMRGLHIVEMEDGTDRLRYRLVGSLSDEFNGIRMTGRYLDEFFTGKTESPARYFDTAYRRIATTEKPEAGEYTWPSPVGTEIHIAFGIFPFISRGEVRQFFYLEDLGDVYSRRRLDPWWILPLHDLPEPAA